MYFDLSSLFSSAVLTKKQRCFLARNVREEDANYEIGILANFDQHITQFFRFFVSVSMERNLFKVIVIEVKVIVVIFIVIPPFSIFIFIDPFPLVVI